MLLIKLMLNFITIDTLLYIYIFFFLRPTIIKFLYQIVKIVN